MPPFEIDMGLLFIYLFILRTDEFDDADELKSSDLPDLWLV